MFIVIKGSAGGVESQKDSGFCDIYCRGVMPTTFLNAT